VQSVCSVVADAQRAGRRCKTMYRPRPTVNLNDVARYNEYNEHCHLNWNDHNRTKSGQISCNLNALAVFLVDTSPVTVTH